ncbi:MAG TPA: hypothetical protein DCY40_07230 [Actinobacteria bacterium]|nr:hypothetical protein [Actinomycetota bacterium]
MTFSDFFDSLGDLEWLAILVGTVAMFIVGWLWYGPLFGKKWTAAHGISGGGGGAPEPAVLIKGFVQTFAINIGIAYFIPALHVAFQNEATLETLIVSSFVLSFFVIGAAFYASVVYLKKSLTVWGIDTGYYFVGIAVAAYVQDLVA